MVLGRCVGGSTAHLEVPVEAANVDSAGILPVVLEGRVVDDVYHRADDGGLVAGYAVQERLQPAVGTLAVGVEVGEDGALRVTSPQQPRPYQPFSSLGTDDLYHREPLHVFFQLTFQVS